MEEERSVFKKLDELNKEAFRKIDEEFLKDNIRRRIKFEEKLLRESVSENGPIVEVKDRCDDGDLVVLVKHKQDQKILLTIRFKFSDEYPLKPPYWFVSQCYGERL